jgi:hypothetical protein
MLATEKTIDTWPTNDKPKYAPWHIDALAHTSKTMQIIKPTSKLHTVCSTGANTFMLLLQPLDES